MIRGVNVFPSQIEAVLAGEEALAPHYILEVTRPDRLDELEVIVETRTALGPDAAIILADRAVHLIKAHVGVTARVRAVAPGTIERSQGKARREYKRWRASKAHPLPGTTAGSGRTAPSTSRK